jgi:hypothetical protein
MSRHSLGSSAATVMVGGPGPSPLIECLKLLPLSPDNFNTDANQCFLRLPRTTRPKNTALAKIVAIAPDVFTCELSVAIQKAN